MTTDLEKQFFSTFGIEPKKGCTAYDKFTEEEADFICNDKCAECSYLDDVYPQITSDRLLELICIISSRVPLFGRAIWQEYLFANVEDLKKGTLIILMGIMSEYNPLNYKEATKHQVQALFKEW